MLEIIDRAWAGNLYVWSAHLNNKSLFEVDVEIARIICLAIRNLPQKTGDEDPAGCLLEIISLGAGST